MKWLLHWIFGLKSPIRSQQGNPNGLGRRSSLDVRLAITCLLGCPLLLAAFAFGINPNEPAGSGPAYIAVVYSPCSGYANLYPSGAKFIGSDPDFVAASMAPITISGVQTWELKILGVVGSGCRPAKTYRLTVPSSNPEGDYCMVSGGCEAGTAAVYIP